MTLFAHTVPPPIETGWEIPHPGWKNCYYETTLVIVDITSQTKAARLCSSGRGGGGQTIFVRFSGGPNHFRTILQPLVGRFWAWAPKEGHIQHRSKKCRARNRTHTVLVERRTTEPLQRWHLATIVQNEVRMIFFGGKRQDSTFRTGKGLFTRENNYDVYPADWMIFWNRFRLIGSKAVDRLID